MVEYLCRRLISHFFYAQLHRLPAVVKHNVVISLLVTATAFGYAAEQKPVPNPCNLNEVDVSGLSGNAARDIQALREYQKTAAGMLRREEFAQLDCVADGLRSRKERFSGGVWKLHTLYAGLRAPVPASMHRTEEDWSALLTRMHAWVSARPQSVTARVAMALAYMDYGWAARGDGYADTVSQSGWKLYEERVAQAHEILESAAKLPVRCPEWYLAMLSVGQSQSWSLSEMRRLYQEATQFEPGYYYYSRVLATYLKPKWSGEPGDSERFVQEAADRIGGAEGDILYFQVANFVMCDCEDSPHLSWDRIVRGFEASEKKYGPSMLNLNLIAHMASHNRELDPVLTDQAISRIGDQWDQETWKTKKNFDAVKKWAADYAPVASQHRAMEAAAEANQKTAAGAAYRVAFEKKYRKLAAECVRSEGASREKFETLTKVGSDGSVEDIRIYWNAPAAVCLYQKLHKFQQKQEAVFPRPPQASYWVRLDLDGAELGPVASK